MSGITFLSENYALTSNLTLDTGTENAQFPLSNLKNEKTVKKFRSVGNAVVIVFDLLQTRDIEAVALAGDATGQFGITSASFKTSVTLDFSGSPVNSIGISTEQNMGYSIIAEVSHRYVELTLTGTGSYVEVGSVYIGPKINLQSNNLSIGSFGYGYDDNSVVSENRYGTKFIDKLPLRKTLVGSIEYATKAEQETLDDMFIFLGKTNPLWVIIDEDGNGMNEGEYKLSIYSYLTEVPSWRASGGQHYSTQLKLEQVI